jgi:hypothetical protein
MEEKQTLPNDVFINPDGTASFQLNAEGDFLGTCTGLFKFKTFLTPLEQLSASRDYRALVGPNPELMSDSERYMAICLSQLKYRIISAPPFWKTGEAFDGNVDFNILSIIFDRALSASLIYKDHLVKKKEESLKTAQEALKAAQDRMNPKKEG